MNGRNYRFSKVKALRKGRERNASLFTGERINFFPLFLIYICPYVSHYASMVQRPTFQWWLSIL